LAICTKLLITKVSMKQAINTILVRTLCVQEQSTICVGLIFVEILMNEITMNSHAMGYFNYTTTLGEFIRQVVDQVFDATFTVTCLLIAKIGSQATEESVNLLELALKSIYALLNFPFENSYISFSTDQDLSDQSITIVPFDWATRLKDLEFLQSMQSLSCSTLLPESSKLRFEAIRLISKLSSCKLDQVLSTNDVPPVSKFFMHYSSAVTTYYDRINKMPPNEVIEQLLDQIGRLFKLYRILKLGKAKDEFKILMNTLVLLSKVAYLSFPDLDNKTFQAVASLWSTVVEQSTYLEYSLGEYMETTYLDFAEAYLLPDSTRSIKLDLPDSIFSENFDKAIQKRFKAFKDLFGSRRESLLVVLDKIIRGIGADTLVGVIYSRKYRTWLGQGHQLPGQFCILTLADW
jgi:hypothetical protein